MYSKKLDTSKKMDNYLSKNLEFLRKAHDLSYADMAEIIGMGKSIVGNYEKGTAEPNASTIFKVVQHFGISLQDLMETDLSVTKKGVQGNGVHLSVHPTVHPSVKTSKEKYIKRGTSVSLAEERPIEHIVDTSGLSIVPIVDIKAAAGGAGYINPSALSADDVIRLPATMVKSGHHLCIRIKGPSMAPTFQDGGYLIIRLLDRSEWLNLRSEYCYVIVDNEGKTYFKRVKNRFSGENGGFIVCMSDNPDKMSHPNFNLHPDEIQYIWYVVWYFTAKMPNIHDQYYSRVSNLEDKVDLLAEEIRSLQKQLK
jgi:transcriptional regulator with XRE-family HTH domain